ncbi:hypothetical protein BJ138DRAFT_1068950 [Hygrophoropsis aurantiaca]|uniref:Uncharacterized protein n=1 Tax=Hygrophoropsis aurantiaca TaxID=72124 RepID=A0ACB8A4S1_9AGAM|nr:hypothetical protein BJ138DRAFT_1068950 [Hygrophoropsis aurantiaca]
MATISTWYHNQYSTWNRTRRMHATPFLARTDTHTSRTATAMARTTTQDVVINMGAADDSTTTKKEKKQDTLFGPNIGVINSTPQWAQSMGKKTSADNISSDVIKTWIAKSKEPSQPTTTLQALVNLKRPTLRLCPLTLSPSDDPSQADSQHHHGLEFEYDCDAPKCKIIVNVILPQEHPLAENVDSSGLSRLVVFESTVEGGFGKVLSLEEGATLELGRFEMSHQATKGEDQGTSATPIELPGESARAADSVEPATSNNTRERKKRFTGFNFRKRTQDRSVSGPALAVVDAELHSPTVSEEDKDKEVKEDSMKEGVRITIKLSALDEDGMDMSSTNEQATYLHIVRLGNAPTDDEEDTRPFVVKVIKREAMIGPHTFHLHEIYGLSSQSTATPQTQTASPVSTDAHTYPPTPAPQTVVHEEEPSSECLLCLSSAREVILLPCRHLVACKECAINMVEFGAGGNITHAEDTAAAAGTEGADPAATPADGAAAPAPSTLPTNTRRKRKAKGWFCPVCRQPYTSLLRISTTPTAKDIGDEDNRASASIDERENEDTSGQEQQFADPLSVTTTPSGGMLNSFRPGFLRRSRNETADASDTLPPDLERGPDPIATAAA